MTKSRKYRKYEERLAQAVLGEFESVDVSLEAANETDRQRASRLRWFEHRKAYYMGLGWPKECAVFIARLGVRIHPHTTKDRAARVAVDKALAKYKSYVRALREKNWSEERITAKALDWIAHGNELRGRSNYNIFTLTSP